MQHDVDWPAIRAEYENGLSLRALASKYGISKSVIGERKYKEQWQQERTGSRTDASVHGVVHPDVNAAVRAATGFRLRFEQYKTWEEVAAASGYASRGAARDAVLREAQRHICRNIDEVRDEEVHRLNQLLMRCYQAALDKENSAWTWAIDRYVNLAKRKAELMGLDQSADSALVANQIVIREVPSGYMGVTEAKS